MSAAEAVDRLVAELVADRSWWPQCEVCGVVVPPVDMHCAHYCDEHRPADYEAQLRGEEPK